MDILTDYVVDLRTACGADEVARPRADELDNTKHAETCSVTAIPGVLGVLLVLFALKRILCRETLRETYSGSEDAPELEEIVSSSGAARRVDAYSSRSGRLVSSATNAAGCGSSKQAPAPRGKRSGRTAPVAELEPVLWRKT